MVEMLILWSDGWATQISKSQFSFIFSSLFNNFPVFRFAFLNFNLSVFQFQSLVCNLLCRFAVGFSSKPQLFPPTLPLTLSIVYFHFSYLQFIFLYAFSFERKRATKCARIVWAVLAKLVLIKNKRSTLSLNHSEDVFNWAIVSSLLIQNCCLFIV